MFQVYISQNPSLYDLTDFQNHNVTDNNGSFINAYYSKTDGICIFDDMFLDDYDKYLLNPKLSLEKNSAGSFEYSILQNFPYYNFLQVNSGIITIKKDDKWFWEGRIIDISDDFYKTRKVQCEGALNYLKDIVLPLYNNTEFANPYGSGSKKQAGINGMFYYIRNLLALYNELQTDSNKKIYVGNIEVECNGNDKNEYGIFKSVNNITAFEAIIDYLLEEYPNTYFTIEKGSNNYLYLNYLNNPEEYETTTQYIEFGENLLEYSSNVNVNDIFTILKPLGGEIKKEDMKGYIDYPQNTIRSDWWQYGYNKKDPTNRIWLFDHDTENQTQNFSILLPKSNVDTRVGTDKKYTDNVRDVYLEEMEELIDSYKDLQGNNKFEYYPSNEVGSSEYLCNINLFKKYGAIVKTVEFGDTAGPHNLLNRALKFFNKYFYTNMEIQIKAFDLSILDNNIDSFEIGDLVVVKSDFYGEAGLLYVDAIEYDFLNASNTSVTLNKRKETNLTELLKNIK